MVVVYRRLGAGAQTYGLAPPILTHSSGYMVAYYLEVNLKNANSFNVSNGTTLAT